MPRKRRKRHVYNKSVGRSYKKGSYDYRYNHSAKAKRNKNLRNKARRRKLKSLTKRHGKAKAKRMLKGKDVDHRRSLKKGGSNSTKNTRLLSRRKNRGRARPTGRRRYWKNKRR